MGSVSKEISEGVVAAGAAGGAAASLRVGPEEQTVDAAVCLQDGNPQQRKRAEGTAGRTAQTSHWDRPGRDARDAAAGSCHATPVTTCRPTLRHSFKILPHASGVSVEPAYPYFGAGQAYVDHGRRQRH